MARKREDDTVEIHGYATRLVREARGRTVQDLANALGVDRSYITHIENGTKRRVSRTLFGAICRELLATDHRALLAVAPEREYVGAPATVEPEAQAS